MAILTGFPPSNTISASVRIAEKDLSFVLPEQSFHRAGLVGFASKGPINIPTLIRSKRQLNTVFGFPHPDVSDPYLIYAAEQYLLVASELYVVRVADVDAVSDESAQTAEIDIPAAGGLIQIISDTAGDYSFSRDSFFRWRLNGELSSKTLVVLSDANRPSPNAGNPYTTDELVEELNLQLDTQESGFGADGIEFFTASGDRIGVRTTFAYGPDSSLELVSVQDAIYGGAIIDGNPTGLGTGMTQGTTTGDGDRYPDDGYQTAGDWDFTGLATNAINLNVVVDGTDNVLIDNIVQVIDLSDLVDSSTYTTANIVTAINAEITAGNIPGGFEAVAVGDNIRLRTLHRGRDARILVKSDSAGFNIFGFDGVTGKGTSPQGTTGDAAVETYGIVNGSTNSSGDITFTIKADSPGIEGNNTKVVVRNDIREGVFNIEVYNNGVQVEAWGNLTKDQTSDYYVETYMSQVSDFIRVEDNTDIAAPPATAVDDAAYVLEGGTDGIPADPDDQDAVLIGINIGNTGIYALSQPESVDIDIIAVPGHSSTSIATALIELCTRYRQDCIALIDPPFGLTVKEVVAWQNGSHPLNTIRFDSDFAALYWPWVKIRDNYNRVDVWVPPSGSIMAVYARNDFLAAPWFAPAGATRGIVPGILDVFSKPSQEEMDLMYGFRNAVNPIVAFADFEGFVVWGQKTLQRRPTALDRVNVRRLLFVLEKRIRAESRVLLFDPHDDQFRDKFVNIATKILIDVQTKRGLTDFIIQADDELNPPDVIDRNEFRARIGIQPTRAVEFMFIEFSVHRTGDFSTTTEF